MTVSLPVVILDFSRELFLLREGFHGHDVGREKWIQIAFYRNRLHASSLLTYSHGLALVWTWSCFVIFVQNLRLPVGIRLSRMVDCINKWKKIRVRWHQKERINSQIQSDGVFVKIVTARSQCRVLVKNVSCSSKCRWNIQMVVCRGWFINSE